MRSYTWGSPEGVQAAIDELPERYPMTLVADDMEALIRALVYTSDSTACAGEAGNDSDHYWDANGYRQCGEGCWRERASGLLSVIAESLNVDWI